MTSSLENPIGPLPPALSSMWRLCKLGFRNEPRLMVASFVLSQLAALPDALLALWLMLLGKGILEHRPVMLRGAAIGLGLSTAATWFLRTVSTRVQRRFRDKVTIALESHVARLQASVATIAHQEIPAYLDRLSMLRNQVFVLDHMYLSVFFHAGVGSPAGRNDGVVGVDSPGVDVVGDLCHSNGSDLHMAARCRASRAGAWGSDGPPGAPFVHPGNDSRTWERSTRHGHRRAPHQATPGRVGGLV